MEKSNNSPEEQKKTTDPQEQEKDGNIFGKAADALFGNSEGGGSMSEEEGKDPEKQGSIKE
jgi:hypothetical protein